MKDQYNNDVPTLAVIEGLDLDELTDEEIKRIVNVRWYEVYLNQGDENDVPICYLMAEYMPIEDVLPELDLMSISADGIMSEDLGGVLVEILSVNDVLKRWSFEDGFYHA